MVYTPQRNATDVAGTAADEKGTHTDMARDAGDRTDPDGIPELFFTQELGYNDADAIATAAKLVTYLDQWGLVLTPKSYLDHLQSVAAIAEN